jgi:hypothetical protein
VACQDWGEGETQLQSARTKGRVRGRYVPWLALRLPSLHAAHSCSQSVTPKLQKASVKTRVVLVAVLGSAADVRPHAMQTACDAVALTTSHRVTPPEITVRPVALVSCASTHADSMVGPTRLAFGYST